MEELKNKIIERFNAPEGLRAVTSSIDDSNFELKKVLEFLGEPNKNKKILDVGCGRGSFTRKLEDKGFEVVGVEPASELVREAKVINKDIQFIQADAASLPFTDDYFDYVLCIEVLEHIPDAESALREMARVLKKRGTFVLIDKNILSLHHVYFIPTYLWKKFNELTNRWMYPRDFPFKEKYFIPWQLNAALKRHFSTSKITFLRFQPDIKKRSFLKKFLLGLHSFVSLVLHTVFPFLDFYVVWSATK